MKFLVDANVLSEPTKNVRVQQVVEWLNENEAEIVVSSIVLGEIWRGVDALAEGRKKQELVEWFGVVRGQLVCLDWTTEIALVWGCMVNDIRRAAFTVGIMDTMIAATAKWHGLTVATRNVADFARCGVEVVNPFG